MKADSPDDETKTGYTARHLLTALQALDPALLEYPVVLVHGKELNKPNVVQGFLPSPTPVDERTVLAKPPALLTLGALVDMQVDRSGNGK